MAAEAASGLVDANVWADPDRIMQTAEGRPKTEHIPAVMTSFPSRGTAARATVEMAG